MSVVPREGITNSDLPEVFDAADTLARTYQRRYFTIIAIELSALVLATLTWALFAPWGPTFMRLLGWRFPDYSLWIWTIPVTEIVGAAVAGVIPAALLLGVGVLMGLRYRLRPDDRWRQYRAVAEEVDALAWRYAMKAQMGELPSAQPNMPKGDSGFTDTVVKLIDQVQWPDLPLRPARAGEITPRMKALRGESNLDILRITYLDGRVRNQQGYYRKRAGDYKRLRRRYRGATLAAVALGALTLPIHGLSVFTTVSTAIGTWTGAHQYEDLAPSYAKLDRELEARIQEGEGLDLSSADGAEQLQRYVDVVETLFEGEHRLWLAKAPQGTP